MKSLLLTVCFLFLMCFIGMEAVKTKWDDCDESKFRHYEECNRCKCKQGNMYDCTKYRCMPDEVKGDYVACVEREVKFENCQMCKCVNETWDCRPTPCKASPSASEPSSTDSLPIQQAVMDDESDQTPTITSMFSTERPMTNRRFKRPRREILCYDGMTRKDQCTECICQNERWYCMPSTCPRRSYTRDTFFEFELRETSCMPGSTMQVDCVVCYCNPNGVGYRCIENQCQPEYKVDSEENQVETDDERDYM